MDPAAIEIEGLAKSFGGQRVLAGVDLRVDAGGIFALLGPNGAGKTTLINILATLILPDEGRARVCGFDVVAQRERVTESISLTGQSAAVDDILTGAENLTMMARLSGFTSREARRRAGELIEGFGLESAARKQVKTYSGGMRRRLDLALSLVASPPVIFLDEPTTGLDARSRITLWDVTRELVVRGTTVLLTTQYLEEADQLADRIGVIDGGRIVADGTAASLKSRVGGDVVELLDRDENVIREVPTDGSAEGLRRALRQLESIETDGTRIGIRKPTMDDVFLALTGGTSAATRTELEATRS